MKKHMLFFLAMLTQCPNMGIWAQTSVVAHLDFPYAISNTIVREHHYPNTISYLETSNGGYFVYADASLSSTILPIDPNCRVNDFVIDNDSVFFCGNSINGEGIVGFFGIQDFFLGSNDYHLTSNINYSPQNSVSVLNKIVAYKDATNVRNIMAIGKTTPGDYCVVNLKYNGVPTFWDCTVGVLPQTLPETLLDIQLTDTYIFTGGMYLVDTLNPCLALRVYNRDSIFFASNSIQDFTTKISDASAQHSFCFEQMALIKLSCDQVGVAAFWKYHQDTGTPNSLVPQEPQGTYIGRYVLGNSKEPVQHIHSIIVTHKYYYGGWKMHGFSKINLSDFSYNLLQEYEEPGYGTMQSFVYEISNNIIDNALPFSYATSGNYIFQSIDGYFALPNYLMNGTAINKDNLLVFNMGQQVGNKCLKTEFLTPDPIFMEESASLEPFNTAKTFVQFQQHYSSSSESTITIDCQ